MRIFSPLNVLFIIIVWTVVFIVFARFFLYGVQEEKEKRLLSSVEFKIDNFDARNMRQLNQLYEEIKKIEELLVAHREEVRQWNRSKWLEVSSKASIAPPGISLKEREVPVLEPITAVLVIACNRNDYVKQTLDELLKYRPSAGLFPIVVSQDCGHALTAAAIAKYSDRITHIKHPDLSEIVIPVSDRTIKNKKAELGYYKISRHYKWALTQVFERLNYKYVIVVEDDLLISSDFFLYFSALRHVLDVDSSIMCVSAWNDNGMEGYISHQKNYMLYRTDFFPGLGWMLTKNLWLELKPKWPSRYWDDWLRQPEQRRDRVCIRPEVSRTKTIGRIGISSGQYFNLHLKYIYLNQSPVDFTKMNLTYLTKDVYDRDFLSHVFHLPLVTFNDVFNGVVAGKHDEVRVQYYNKKDFETSAKRLKIMPDLRGGVPRTAYLGIVSFMYKSVRVHLVPPSPWQGYDHL